MSQLALDFGFKVGDGVHVPDIDRTGTIKEVLHPISCKNCLHSKISNPCQDQQPEGCVPGYYYDDEDDIEHRIREPVYYIEGNEWHTWKMARELIKTENE